MVIEVYSGVNSEHDNFETSVISADFQPSYETISYIETFFGKDETDLYFPEDRTDEKLPAVLLLQGALIDKSYYSEYATELAKYGFIVAVPNHKNWKAFGNYFAEVTEITQGVDSFYELNNNTESPLFESIDTGTISLAGHSHGGIIGLNALSGKNPFSIFSGGWSTTYDLPDEVKAGVFYGTNHVMRIGNMIFPGKDIDTGDKPVTLIQGDRDTAALYVDTVYTYDHLLSETKHLARIDGATHYALTNIQNPPGPYPNTIPPTIDQDESISLCAQLGAAYLMADLFDNEQAKAFIKEYEE